MRGLSLALVALLACAGCANEPRPRGLVEQAEFGIFFGGQVQERDEIPFSLDRARQTQGIRIELHEPARTALPVRWELDMPGTTRRVRDAHGRRGKGRVVKTGSAELRPGQQRLDLELPFEPGDPLGTWNVRVTLAEQVVIDRPFLVYDAARRKRAERQARADERAARRESDQSEISEQ